ncbi:MAG: cytochrome c oxidase subunit II [Deltaproteobacteria bacterium]|nr:cytochrome c oxidase subunit II [Deltaproteobacteria bacterium]
MLSPYLEVVSTYAGDIDNLILLITVVTGVWFIAAELVLFGFVFMFRDKGDNRKAMYINGTEPQYTRFISIPHALVLICDLFIVTGAISVWVNVKQTLPQEESTIRVIGQQWAWSFVHPGPDNILDTDDDIKTVDELHIKANTTYHYELRSRDVMHSFSVPVFRLKQDAVPGRTIKGWFTATKTGTWDIQCAEMCGVAHGIMRGSIHIENAEVHDEWMLKNSPAKSLVVLPKKKVTQVDDASPDALMIASAPSAL